jgi:hypothetical protein
MTTTNNNQTGDNTMKTVTLTNSVHSTQTTIQIRAAAIARAKRTGKLDWTALTILADDGDVGGMFWTTFTTF